MEIEVIEQRITIAATNIVGQTITGKVDHSRGLNELDRIAISLEMRRDASENEHERDVFAILIEFVSRMYMYVYEFNDKPQVRQ